MRARGRGRGVSEFRRSGEHGRAPGEPVPERRQPHRAAAHATRYAAIDLGTHNCRMLVAERLETGRPRIIEAMSRPVRLGEGLAASGRLGEAPMARAIDALSACAQRLRALHVTHVDTIATEACRRAANAEEFVARARAATGLPVRIITPEEEAALTLNGCTGLLDPRAERALLFDIGGGSTEVMWVAHDGGRGARPLALISLPLGVVTLAERYGGDRISVATYQAMSGEIEERLAAAALPPLAGDALAGDALAGDAIGGHGVQMLGTSGTVTTLGALHLGLGAYDRNRVDGIEISFAAIAALSVWLIGLDYRERAAIACIGRERADLVIAGCAILDAICRRWPVGRLTVADRGIREGILLALMHADVRTTHGDARPAALMGGPAGEEAV